MVEQALDWQSAGRLAELMGGRITVESPGPGRQPVYGGNPFSGKRRRQRLSFRAHSIIRREWKRFRKKSCRKEIPGSRITGKEIRHHSRSGKQRHLRKTGSIVEDNELNQEIAPNLSV